MVEMADTLKIDGEADVSNNNPKYTTMNILAFDIYISNIQ